MLPPVKAPASGDAGISPREIHVPTLSLLWLNTKLPPPCVFSPPFLVYSLEWRRHPQPRPSAGFRHSWPTTPPRHELRTLDVSGNRIDPGVSNPGIYHLSADARAAAVRLSDMRWTGRRAVQFLSELPV